jgi:ectoine hydroxylase-related dioxygenase (phytanoyl-CoA dioxygenase family)
MSSTLSRARIGEEQIEQFHRDGYCVVDGLFSPAEIDEIEAFFEEFKLKGYKIFDGNMIEDVDPTKYQVRAMHPHRYSDKVRDWLIHPEVAAVLEVLLGKPALGVQTMYYFKPPGAKGQGMHQDNFYLVSAPATCIAAWTAIDAADLENGCLYVAPGSHRRDILCPDKAKSDTWFEYGDSHIAPFPRDLKPIPVTVPKGATLFFGGNLVHGSGPNRTQDRSRRTFIGHYIDEASERVGKHYHPVLAMDGTVVSNVKVYEGGGPCGDGWQGGVH